MNADDRARYEASYQCAQTQLGQRREPVAAARRVVSRWRQTRSPADRSVIVAEVPDASRDDLAEAITQAQSSYQAWSRRRWTDRVDIIRRAADTLHGQTFDIAALLTIEIGKTWIEAVYDVQEAVDVMRYYADQFERANGMTVPISDGSAADRSVSVMRPYGPWLVISPFNFPLALAAGPVSAALLTGNTVVLKPSELAPLSAYFLADALLAAGVPEGAIAVVTAGGTETSAVIEADHRIAGVAFTGSADVGCRLAARLSPRAAPLIAEMGGKNAAIVTCHADLDDAAHGIARSAFGFAGQKCSSNSRVYIESPVYDEVVSLICQNAQKMRVGLPQDETTTVGPVISEQSVARYEEALAAARGAGASVECGGLRLTGDGLDRGLFLAPTVITGLAAEHTLLRQELFVPLTIVAPVASLQEALSRANDSDYGLTAGLYSLDDQEIQEFVDGMQAGVLYVNRRQGATTGARVGVQTFGGWKGSGSTGKNSYGPYYLHGFLREQSQTFGQPSHR
jgi:1-pyrroline-5-carboxylate dehydrogenase